MVKRFGVWASVPVLAVSLASCSSLTGMHDTVATDTPTVLNVIPANAASNVDPTRPVVVSFSQPMVAGMEALVVLHEGPVTGPVVAGTAVWSTDRSVLTFTPVASLKSGTSHTLHLSPGLMGANGQPINLATCVGLGGHWVTSGTMGATGGMTNGSWGPGMMGSGWQAPNGTFGMLFTFSTF